MSSQIYLNSVKFRGNNQAPQIWFPESSAYTSTLNMQSIISSAKGLQCLYILHNKQH